MNEPTHRLVADPDDVALVVALARAASLSPLPDEIEAAAADLPRVRAAIAGLYALPIDHEEEPVTIFHA